MQKLINSWLNARADESEIKFKNNIAYQFKNIWHIQIDINIHYALSWTLEVSINVHNGTY